MRAKLTIGTSRTPRNDELAAKTNPNIRDAGPNYSFLRFFLTILGDVLCDTPQHAGRIDDHEVAHAPWPVGRRLGHDAIRRDHVWSLDMAPPRIEILHQKMHHEIAGVLLDVEILQQETRWAVTKVGEIVVGPGEIKSEILIKTLGQIKIPCRDECLDLDGCHVGHGRIPRVE